MPIHDWTRVPAGLFHHFHQSWSIRITDALNAGVLPQGLSALVEQRAGLRQPDVLAIESRDPIAPSDRLLVGAIATADRPSAKIVRRSTHEIYSGRANRVVVRHHLGRIVAVIEIISPGNKGSRAALGDFVEKTIDLLRAGIHVLVIDLFPPTPRDPLGIHKAIWDEIQEEDFVFPTGKDRILVSYESGLERVAYIEPIGLGDSLPDMPLFVAPGLHVQVPLRVTYEANWKVLPEDFRQAIETGKMPEDLDGPG
jgi:hypothetical protein